MVVHHRHTLGGIVGHISVQIIHKGWTRLRARHISRVMPIICSVFEPSNAFSVKFTHQKFLWMRSASTTAAKKMVRSKATAMLCLPFSAQSSLLTQAHQQAIPLSSAFPSKQGMSMPVVPVACRAIPRWRETSSRGDAGKIGRSFRVGYRH